VETVKALLDLLREFSHSLILTSRVNAESLGFKLKGVCGIHVQNISTFLPFVVERF
jgi:hypothetical protein